MDKILSQDEINALFTAMASDGLPLEAGPDASASQRKISTYDFHRADRISQDQLRSLHLLHEDFGRDFSSSLSAYLRAFIDVRLASLEQVSYAEFLKLLPDPTLVSSFGMRPLDSNMLVELNPTLVFPMIDMLLGGPGSAPADSRTLTEIEMNIIEGVIRLVMRDLKETWRPVMEIDFFLEGTAAKPQVFQIVSAGETVVAFAFEIKVGENIGTMNICIPSRILKVVRSRFDHQRTMRRQKSDGSEAERLMHRIQWAQLRLSGEMRESSLTVDDLLRVSAGDIIPMNKRMGDPVVLCVEGTPKFMGHIVMHRGKKAFEITQRIEE